MGRHSLVSARITVQPENHDKTVAFLQTLKNDDTYPYIRTEMFSIGTKEVPHQYFTSIIAFAASYKNIEDHFTDFVIKFEHVLRNIDFNTCKLHLETEYFNDYNFMWVNKKTNHMKNDDVVKNQLIETDTFYFGYGNRTRYGTLRDTLNDTDCFDKCNFGFSYPINKE